jgi:hypothetical protein
MVNTAALHAANASSNLVKAIPLNYFTWLSLQRVFNFIFFWEENNTFGWVHSDTECNPAECTLASPPTPRGLIFMI